MNLSHYSEKLLFAPFSASFRVAFWPNCLFMSFEANVKSAKKFNRPPAETRPLRAGYFQNNVGPSTKLGPPTLIPGLKAWVHKFFQMVR